MASANKMFYSIHVDLLQKAYTKEVDHFINKKKYTMIIKYYYVSYNISISISGSMM